METEVNNRCDNNGTGNGDKPPYVMRFHIRKDKQGHRYEKALDRLLSSIFALGLRVPSQHYLLRGLLATWLKAEHVELSEGAASLSSTRWIR